MVKELSWTSRFVLGLPFIDEQHQELIRHLNAVVYSISKEVDLSMYQDLMGFLRSYAQQHFQDEEKLMETVGFPEFLAHRALHQEFILQLHAFEREPETTVTLAHINNYLVDWLDHHIDVEDRRLAEFIHNQ